MKYILVIGDGMADFPVEALGGRTPLEAAQKPTIDGLARRGIVSEVKTVPDGVPAGSDTAILSIFGYDPRKVYTGRSPLEAAGSGVRMQPGNVSFRCNLAKSPARMRNRTCSPTAAAPSTARTPWPSCTVCSRTRPLPRCWKNTA